ncbi:MAG TPA: ATP-binding protein [Steroidobacteraceae bacterium]
MNTRSLSFRLIAWYASVLTLVFLVLGAATLWSLRHYLEANLLDSQVRRARQIADTLLAAASRTGDAPVAQQVEDLYSPEANDRFIRITRADGSLVFASGPPADHAFDPANVPPIPPRTRSVHVRSGAVIRKAILPEAKLLIASVSYSGTNDASYVVEVGLSTAGMEATLRHLLVMLGIGLPIAVLVAVGGGFILVRRALRPVAHIANKAELISQQNLRERLPQLRTGDELEHLSISLNHMITRLEEAILSSKRFVADASHELRTPLTVMRGELESLAQDPKLQGETRETLGSALEEVDRLADIVDGLLALSRLDAGEANSERVMFDLAELATTTADQMSLLAEDRNITVRCEAAGGVFVEGDRPRMKQVVVNLLDNAIKYTPKGGHVLLKIARQGGQAILEVADDGMGIPPEALPHMFERFFRVDDSRSREQGGAGLGLSIVKSICTVHGAEVEVTSTVGNGSCFRVTQPLAGHAARTVPHR